MMNNQKEHEQKEQKKQKVTNALNQSYEEWFESLKKELERDGKLNELKVDGPVGHGFGC